MSPLRAGPSPLPSAAAVMLAGCLAGCATAKTAPPQPQGVDLQPARGAVESARQAGASEKAGPVFTRAVGHLAEAESLAAPGQGPAAERSREAAGLARLALSEAQCAESMARMAGAAACSESGGLPAGDAERLRSQLRRSEEEQRRLEERVALLQRDLDVTETEVIRTKAKLKGLETKAEASSVIAEARILLRRVLDEKGRSANLSRCQELLDRAEQQLRDENYGAAVFFASKAQDLLGDARRVPQGLDRPPPKGTYRVKAGGANVRSGPGLGEPVLGKLPAGASVTASAVRGDWIKVRHGELSGWTYGALLE